MVCIIFHFIEMLLNQVRKEAKHTDICALVKSVFTVVCSPHCLPLLL